MEKKEKEHKNSQKAFPDTLGTRLFAFGEHKIASIKKMVQRSSQHKLFVKKFRILGRIGFQSRGNLTHRRKTPISLIYARPPVLVNFEAYRTTEKHSTSVQRLSLPPRILKLLSSLERTSVKSSFPIPSLKTIPIPLLRRRKGRIDDQSDEQAQDTMHSPKILKRLPYSPVAPNAEERRRTQEDVMRSLTIPSPQGERVRVRVKRSVQETTLPPQIQHFFSRLLRIRLPSVRIHQDTISDKFLSTHHADAMTVGRDIFFKPGKFDLKSARGLALLGHELTHVAQQETTDWRNSPVDRNAEHQERSARENERFILVRAQFPNRRGGSPTDVLSPPLVGGVRGGGMPSTTKTRPSTPVSARPMFADESRDVSVLPDMRPEEVQPITLSESEMSRIKEEVYRDLMLRIKIDFERGA